MHSGINASSQESSISGHAFRSSGQIIKKQRPQELATQCYHFTCGGLKRAGKQEFDSHCLSCCIHRILSQRHGADDGWMALGKSPRKALCVRPGTIKSRLQDIGKPRHVDSDANQEIEATGHQVKAASKKVPD